jgi:hypothetical protein
VSSIPETYREACRELSARKCNGTLDEETRARLVSTALKSIERHRFRAQLAEAVALFQPPIIGA